MPKRRYKNLKNLMYEQEITQQQLSKITGCHKQKYFLHAPDSSGLFLPAW